MTLNDDDTHANWVVSVFTFVGWMRVVGRGLSGLGGIGGGGGGGGGGRGRAMLRQMLMNKLRAG